MPDSQLVVELKQRLQALYNTDDPNFKILFAGKNSTYTLPAINPSDLDLGCFANILEFTKLLAQDLILQINLQTATGDSLDFLARYSYDIYRDTGESDADFRLRIVDAIFGVKETRHAILNAVIPYNGDPGGGIYPLLLEGTELLDLGAIADFTYADYYKRHVSPPASAEVFPALCNEQSTSGIPRKFLRIYMLSVLEADKIKVYEIVKRLHAAGVRFQIFFLTESIFG